MLRANPCGARIESLDLKEPIPVLREIRPWWIGKAYSIGLSDTSNDYPLGSNGFFSNAFLRHSWRRAAQLIKGLCFQAFFIWYYQQHTSMRILML